MKYNSDFVTNSSSGTTIASVNVIMEPVDMQLAKKAFEDVTFFSQAELVESLPVILYRKGQIPKEFAGIGKADLSRPIKTFMKDVQYEKKSPPIDDDNFWEAFVLWFNLKYRTSLKLENIKIYKSKEFWPYGESFDGFSEEIFTYLAKGLTFAVEPEHLIDDDETWAFITNLSHDQVIHKRIPRYEPQLVKYDLLSENAFGSEDRRIAIESSRFKDFIWQIFLKSGQDFKTTRFDRFDLESILHVTISAKIKAFLEQQNASILFSKYPNVIIWYELMQKLVMYSSVEELLQDPFFEGAIPTERIISNSIVPGIKSVQNDFVEIEFPLLSGPKNTINPLIVGDPVHFSIEIPQHKTRFGLCVRSINDRIIGWLDMLPAQVLKSLVMGGIIKLGAGEIIRSDLKSAVVRISIQY